MPDTPAMTPAMSKRESTRLRHAERMLHGLAALSGASWDAYETTGAILCWCAVLYVDGEEVERAIASERHHAITELACRVARAAITHML